LFKEHAMFVKLRVVQDEFEAQQVEGFLKEAGIEYERVSFRDTALDGLFQGQKGYALIRVAEGDRAKAEQLLAEELGNVQSVDAAAVEREALEAKPMDAKSGAAEDGRSTLWFWVVVVVLVLGAIIFLLQDRPLESFRAPPPKAADHGPLTPQP
jgi:hypothetical protein